MKRDGYQCRMCGRKQSRAKGKEVYVEVHHIDGARMEKAIDAVFEYLLCDPDGLATVCKSCHRGGEHDIILPGDLMFDRGWLFQDKEGKK